MRRVVATLTFVVVPAAVALIMARPGVAQTAPAAPSAVSLGWLDRSADACTDFYQFACGGWRAANPIPPDRQRWGQFAALEEENFTILRKILEGSVPAGDADRRKAADYYAACMDESAIEAGGIGAIVRELARIDEVSRSADLAPLLAHLHEIGVPAFFRFGSQVDRRDATQQIASVDQGGIALPDRDYYLKTDARSVSIRQKYAAHIGKTLALLPGASLTGGSRPAVDAEAVVALERAMAEAELDRTARRDPAATDHMMPREDLQTLMPSFDWAAYVTATGAPPFKQLNVASPAYFRALNALLLSTPIDIVKEYLRWQLVNASAELLPRAFESARFDFFSGVLGGQEQPLPRWRRCVTQTDARLGEALGKAFIDEAFSASAKADTRAMVVGIKAAMKKDIDEATWMSDETRRAARAKLDAVVDRIGYPDKWKDYASIRVDKTDALGNRERAQAYERRRTLQKIGQRVDRTEWTMTPPTVNAYYSSNRNNINFPAGILQPPFYRAGRDAAVNYGGIGAVVGHELTHGFDDQGRKFDANGNLRNWWTGSDAKNYEARSSCIADQYSQYVVAGDTHINGRLTLGENTADNGGVRLALMAYLAGPGATATPIVDGFTREQRFFLGFAQIWCESRRDELERQRALTDSHSSGRYRVNGTVSNMPEFAKAFSCKADAPMVRQNACRVW
jgi:endothelin-converting enzyme/putative endopeptidase